MCTPAIAIAGISAVATVAGGIMQANAQKSVAQAQMNAAMETQRAQEQGFFTRMTAQQDQNQRDAAIQQSAIDAQNQAQQQLADQQNQARAQREAQIQQANDQTQAIGSKAQQLVQQTESQVSPENLAAAQTRQAQQIQELASPGTASIASGTATTNAGPVAAPVASTDNQTQSAIATRLAQAAAATRTDTANKAQLASYQAPLTAMQTAGTDLATAAGPLAFAQKRVESGLPAYLAPSTVSYGNASNYYQNLLKAIEARTQGRKNVSETIANGQITNADLQQADTATAAQNAAAIKAWQVASDPTPGIVGSLGQIGLYSAGRFGAGNSAISDLKNIFS
jgi:hypothetical protein